MTIEVNKNYVNFNSNTKVNKKEFKATPLYFIFSEEYKGLTCKCVFSKIPSSKDEEITYYQEPIINNMCYIPYEVMSNDGIMIGVYGYEVNGNDLVIRYSPEPKNLWFLEGSYYEGASTPEEISPSQFEQYTSYLNNEVAKLNRIKIETKTITNGVKIEVTNSDGITTETNIYNGEQGPEGPQGETGATGAPGRDGYVQYTAGDNITIDNNVISATDTTYEAGTGIDITNNVISATGGSGGEETKIFYLSGEYTRTTSANLNATDLETLKKFIDYYMSGKNCLLIVKKLVFKGSNDFTPNGLDVIGNVSTDGSNLVIDFYFNRPFFQYNRIVNGNIYSRRIIVSSNTPSTITSASFSASSNPDAKSGVITVGNTASYNVTGDYNPAHKKYVDDKPTTYAGYDATKTQILKNINGTLTWVDEV